MEWQWGQEGVVMGTEMRMGAGGTRMEWRWGWVMGSNKDTRGVAMGQGWGGNGKRDWAGMGTSERQQRGVTIRQQ